MPRSKNGVKRVKVEGGNVEKAVVVVLNNNFSIRQASIGICRNDVNRVFCLEEEEALKNYLKQASLMHYGLTRKPIRPFPKAGARKLSRVGPKPGRCRVLTDTPEKNEVEAEETLRKSKEKPKAVKQVKRKIVEKEISSSSDGDDVHYSSSDSLEDVELETAESPDVAAAGEYALVRVAGKKKEHFYVAEVRNVTGCVTLEVQYLKRAKSFEGNKFVYGSEQIYELSTKDIVQLLPKPVVSAGSTARQTNFILFPIEFTNYIVE